MPLKIWSERQYRRQTGPYFRTVVTITTGEHHRTITENVLLKHNPIRSNNCTSEVDTGEQNIGSFI